MPAVVEREGGERPERSKPHPNLKPLRATPAFIEELRKLGTFDLNVRKCYYCKTVYADNKITSKCESWHSGGIVPEV